MGEGEGEGDKKNRVKESSGTTLPFIPSRQGRENFKGISTGIKDKKEVICPNYSKGLVSEFKAD